MSRFDSLPNLFVVFIYLVYRNILQFLLSPRIYATTYDHMTFFRSTLVTPTELTRNFTVVIHSSNATKNRLGFFLKRYYRPIPGINYLVVYPERAVPYPGIPYLITPCAGVRDTVRGLNCRDQVVYEYFLNNSWMGDFMYRAMDDTILSIENLWRYIVQLRQVYDPYKEVVFRTSINTECNRRNGTSWIGGGAGWLQSRAMVAVHTLPTMSMEWMYHPQLTWQDDITQTRIFQRLGFSEFEVGETRLTDDCHEFCAGPWWRVLDFKGAGKCGEGEVMPMNELISYHSGKHEKLVQAFGMMLGRYPDNLYFWRKPSTKGVRPCIADPHIVNEKLSLEYMKRTARHMTFDEARRRVKFTAKIYAEFMEKMPKNAKYYQPEFTYTFDPEFK